jgi:hypothetical protein
MICSKPIALSSARLSKVKASDPDVSQARLKDTTQQAQQS